MFWNSKMIGQEYYSMVWDSNKMAQDYYMMVWNSYEIGIGLLYNGVEWQYKGIG